MTFSLFLFLFLGIATMTLVAGFIKNSRKLKIISAILFLLAIILAIFVFSSLGVMQ